MVLQKLLLFPPSEFRKSNWQLESRKKARKVKYALCIPSNDHAHSKWPEPFRVCVINTDFFYGFIIMVRVQHGRWWYYCSSNVWSSSLKVTFCFYNFTKGKLRTTKFQDFSACWVANKKTCLGNYVCRDILNTEKGMSCPGRLTAVCADVIGPLVRGSKTEAGHFNR